MPPYSCCSLPFPILPQEDGRGLCILSLGQCPAQHFQAVSQSSSLNNAVCKADTAVLAGDEVGGILPALEKCISSRGDVHKLKHTWTGPGSPNVCNARIMDYGVASSHEEEERGLRATLRVKVEIMLCKMALCSLSKSLDR